jgi:hypothetical protein
MNEKEKFLKKKENVSIELLLLIFVRKENNM